MHDVWHLLPDTKTTSLHEIAISAFMQELFVDVFGNGGHYELFITEA